jgi:hypothetical protein
LPHLAVTTQSGLEISSGISQEQGVRKETKDNGGLESEHQGRSGSNSSNHAATSDAELPEKLREFVDNNGRHLTDAIFRK